MVSRNKWIAGIAILAVVVVAGGVAYSKSGSGGSSSKKDLIILNDVQRRTLQDTVTLQGTLARQELRKVTSVSQSRVSGGWMVAGARNNGVPSVTPAAVRRLTRSTSPARSARPA